MSDRSKTVWKVPLNEPITRATLPDGSAFLHFDRNPRPEAEQTGFNMGLACWFFVDPDRPKTEHNWNLVITGTGHPVPLAATHLGTVVMENFAWHLWRFTDEQLEGND